MLDKTLTGFDPGLVTGRILVDLQKAFNTINYELLLKKCPLRFSNQPIISWFKSYISNTTNTLLFLKLTVEYHEDLSLDPYYFYYIYICADNMNQTIDYGKFIYADDSWFYLSAQGHKRN